MKTRESKSVKELKTVESVAALVGIAISPIGYRLTDEAGNVLDFPDLNMAGAYLDGMAAARSGEGLAHTVKTASDQAKG